MRDCSAAVGIGVHAGHGSGLQQELHRLVLGERRVELVHAAQDLVQVDLAEAGVAVQILELGNTQQRAKSVQQRIGFSKTPFDQQPCLRDGGDEHDAPGREQRAVPEDEWRRARAPQRAESADQRARSSGFPETVTAAAHGVDQRQRLAGADLAPQSSHVHVDDVGARIEAVAPHRLEYHRACQYLA